MRSIRQSFGRNPPPISTPISVMPAIPKPLPLAQPPQRVVRCIRPFRSQSPEQLSASPGEFLYVVRDISRPDGDWYEVTNPMNNSRGIVPQSHFELMSKTMPASIQAGPNAKLPPNLSRASSTMTIGQKGPKHKTFYAIVQYDFQAERPDELDAKAGEPISVVAQSNREWFVAKPIGRLGGPGLIPVSFVEIRDPTTNLAIRDIDGLMDAGILPRVEEWKQATAEYKASSIPLGVVDEPTGEGVKDSPFTQQRGGRQSQQQAGMMPSPPQQYNQQPQAQGPRHDRSHSQARSVGTTNSRAVSHADPDRPLPANPDLLPPGAVVAASIPSFHFENEEYWFRIDATYQTHDSPSAPSRTLQLVLYRNYDDFYDFQITLLDAFPVEAGRVPPDDVNNNGYPTPPASVEEGSTRILPYMPGPVSFVDDMITSVRRTELDQYLIELCALDRYGAGHILHHDLVRSFFSPKSGDVVDEVDGPTPGTTPSAAPWPKNAGGGISAPPPEQDEDDNFGEDDSYPNDSEMLAKSVEKMRLQDNSEARSSGGSYDNYGPRGPGSSRMGQNGGSARYSGGEYAGRSSIVGRQSRDSSPQKNVPRTLVEEDDSRPSSFSGNGSHAHSFSYSSTTGGSTLSTLSPPLNQHPYGGQGGSRSARSSGGNTGASQPDESSPAFLKIKIFHSDSDDLIAIRVPPKVTYTQLINKVRDRLGAAVQMLRYRESFDGKSWRSIGSDGDLRDWINRGDKLVLYAE